MATPIKVDPGTLHSAGATAASHADALRGAAGSAGGATQGLGAAAAHPDAGAAIDAYMQMATRGLAAFADEIAAYSSQLHGAADGYVNSDTGAARGVSHAG